MIQQNLSNRQLVFQYLRDHPIAKNKEIYEAFPTFSKGSIRDYKKQFFDNLQEEIDLDIPIKYPRRKLKRESIGNTKVLHLIPKDHIKLDLEIIENTIDKILDSDNLDVNFTIKVKGEEFNIEGFLTYQKEVLAILVEDDEKI